MRLVRLSMCAFGPYKDEQTIEFSHFNDRKLFLITGPTGAGKTSVFDAISYALFGNASGNSRDADSFRSDFASVDDETYVSLQFQLKGINYLVKRSPKQEKRKIRGEGTTTKQAEAILEIENGKTYTGVTEVNNQIQEIIGINHHQFKQIVMLPQGEFRRLLEANSQERELIFRNLFKTEDFLVIQEQLKFKTSQLKNEIGDVYKLLDNYISHIVYDAESPLASSVNATYKDYESIMLLLNERINIDEKSLDKLVQNLKKKEEEIYQLSEAIQQGQMLNEKFSKEKELKLLKNQLQEKKNEIGKLEIKVKKAGYAQVVYQIEEQINKINDSLKNLSEKEKSVLIEEKEKQKGLLELNELLETKQKALNEVKQLNECLFKLKDKLSKYQDYDEKVKDLKKIENKREELKNLIERKEKNITETNKNISYLSESLESHQELNQQLSDYRLKQDSIKNQMKNREFLLSVLNDLINLQEKHRKLSENYQQKHLDYQKSRNEYANKFEYYLLGQAGILAHDLKNNEPCPVCGSTHHPKKAMLFENVPTTKELDDLKRIFEQKEKLMNECYSEVFSLNNGIIDKKKLVNQLSEDQSDNFDLLNQISNSKELLDQDRSHLDHLNHVIKKLEVNLEKNSEIENEIEKNRENKNQMEDELRMINQSFSEFDKQYHVKLETINRYKETIIKDYPNKSSLILEIKQLETEIEKITQDFQLVFNKREEQRDALLVLETNLTNLRKAIVDYQESLEGEDKKFREKLAVYHFTSLDEYRGYLFNAEELKDFENEIRDYYNEVSYVDKTLNDLKEVLKENKIIDIETLIEKQNQVKEELNQLRNNEKELLLMIQNNNKIYKDIKSLYKKMKSQLMEYEVLSDISKAANGDNPQKLTFERYVLAAYFDEIIQAANNRLGEMTNNRYFLCRKEEKGKGRGQQGLDLEVVDNYTSKSRLVKTLSGGEAFIASLSLALGLADVVQSYSGGIQLDTIFIDEGFGSLDPESLEQAISMLVNIQKSGRLVGIISHVQELKERIDVKLEIKPSQSGSIIKPIFHIN
ncbi:SMC family ATPase [Mycoplasmatota bacterium]|nr:SMC family ATPase [Mycoplasmatota bacterium]